MKNLKKSLLVLALVSMGSAQVQAVNFADVAKRTVLSCLTVGGAVAAAGPVKKAITDTVIGIMSQKTNYRPNMDELQEGGIKFALGLAVAGVGLYLGGKDVRADSQKDCSSVLLHGGFEGVLKAFADSNMANRAENVLAGAASMLAALRWGSNPL